MLVIHHPPTAKQTHVYYSLELVNYQYKDIKGPKSSTFKGCYCLDLGSPSLRRTLEQVKYYKSGIHPTFGFVFRRRTSHIAVVFIYSSNLGIKRRQIHKFPSIDHRPSAIHHPSSIIHHPSSIIHHPSSIIHHPSSIIIIHHPPIHPSTHPPIPISKASAVSFPLS
ncbi:hypothetical protein DID88_006292 [Monilinia fructigena]|uniref:Uncharacterized protein n=1 Tax=Monilinia fructigena TaxID=38457 RepID=A0A395J297_9HELO|nr:hypothetical protein DID88_006292 [Monilinia fructigena]